MPEEGTSSRPHNNGERVGVRVGSKSLEVSAKDLVPILLLLLMGVGGYLLYTNVQAGLQSLERQQIRIEHGMHENREHILRLVADWRSLVEAQTDTIRGYLEIHEWNMRQEPAQRLPLATATPPSKP